MESEQGCAKRSRSESVNVSLISLLEQGKWEEAIDHVRCHPEDGKASNDPSPLALACRLGAPIECVRLLLEAAPDRLRHVLDSRGTPLHEAVVCEQIGVDVIDLLLKADEALEIDGSRAALLQDVDGFTPLHLLIRRRFQSHILNPSNDVYLMEILESLVSSCPQAVVIPDLGEYEEPPIVYAIKANIYAPLLGSEDDTMARVERQIYEMVETMLKHAPSAAAQVFSGFRGQYTALHSAVFHGRYTNTINLLLETGKQHPSATNQVAALLTNTQLEVPLHFCAMRGERPRTVALLANAYPEAVLMRDAYGLTPFHWIWVRFASTLLGLDDDRRVGVDGSILLRSHLPVSYETNRYNCFVAIEQGDFDSDLQLIKRLDPPTDFLHMRNIPREVADSATGLRCAKRAVEVLQRIRERHLRPAATEEQLWTRQEAVMSLFWSKCVSMIEASSVAEQAVIPSGDNFSLVHTAFASQCCLPPVAFIAASIFPEELRIRDQTGRLPIHYAASRVWHSWDWRQGESSPAARLLQRESMEALRVAFDLSPRETMRVTDNDNCLVLHLFIENVVRACSQNTRSSSDRDAIDLLQFLRELVTASPESLLQRDGRTKLYPFLQVAAVATEYCKVEAHTGSYDEMPVSMTYELLRENPTVLFGS